jgi:hypothetical protein
MTSLQLLFKDILPYFTIISNFIICFLFTKIELKSIFQNIFDQKFNSTMISLYTAALIAIITIVFPPGYEYIWPLQNIVNIFIGVTIGKLIQLSQLPIILLSLSCLTLYDAVAVLGTQRFTDGGQSIMEQVARSKLIDSADTISTMAYVDNSNIWSVVTSNIQDIISSTAV